MKEEIINDLSESADELILITMLKVIKLLNVKWNVPEKKDSGKTSSYINAVVLRYSDEQYLLVMQHINILNSITKIGSSPCCGILSFKLSKAESSESIEQFMSNVGEYCIKKDVIEAFQGTGFFKTGYNLSFSEVYFIN